MGQLLEDKDLGYVFRSSLKELATTPWLSARPQAHRYIQFDLPDWNEKIAKKNGRKLIGFVSGFKSGEYIAKKHYTDEETGFVYLSVACFSGENIALDKSNYLRDKEGEKYKHLFLKEGDLVVTRSGTVGSWHLFEAPEGKKYIPSHHLSFTRITNSKIRFFLKYYLNSRHILPYIQTYSTGKSQKELNNWSIKRIPIPTKIDFDSIDSHIEEIEQQIKDIQKRIESVQDIIDDILVKMKVKEESFSPIIQESFSNQFAAIAKNSFLRAGAQYHAFYAVHNSLLFDSVPKDIPVKKLSGIIKLSKNNVFKKGILNDEYILLDLEQLEAKTGKIKTEDNIVSEIGSDKVLFGDADIVISKIDPYLAYIFINDKSKNYIGSTEILPFKLLSNEVGVHYLKYLLLSHDYIQKSALLMYGKRHPRIHHKDLLAIKIPVPKQEIQEQIVSEIQAREQKSDRYREEIRNLRSQIDNIIYDAIK